MAMPTKPCMVMLRTGVDGGRYQEDGAVWAVVPCGVSCVRLPDRSAVSLSASLTSQTQSTQESASQRDGLYDNFTVG